MEKTNAVRLLERLNLPFSLFEYQVDDSDVSAKAVAQKNGLDLDRVFKTLVLRGSSGSIFVCVIPGECTVDLKKAARAAGEKKAELIGVKELLSLTGYIRGGCSPLCMKKEYPTYIDETCQLYDRIYVSAGMRGLQLLISPEILIEVAHAHVADLV
ncbi:MAG: Cys-tRNA(Pro) deacylase [Sphaerochaetaceae bacterium]|nr:Cys-tRNA(Pro) deacylase [Sphaerochaetaceae bacterium]